ncbi:Mei2/Mei2-like C-terminal RNA recognition motif [Arabidopsis suecica]|uniref:Mei2/Mei2-like C-terminal RNA recognition motif n=1 Tax=Arabidopsis suecica TaxID=45249 RepID=A0A8T2CIU0_ARASU|nr:Mei2/Mei2-like C-terminal RNA recognition motif [Arabidopsis suecica]
MEKKKPIKSLNPNAPEYLPRFSKNPNLYYPPPSCPSVFNFNKPFPCSTKPCKAITGADVKSEKEPFRYEFCHRRCLPPRLLKKQVWVHKNHNFSSAKVVPLPENKLAGKASVMVRNIPNCLGRTDLLRILDNHCRKHKTESSYDFLYLPMDFVKRANLGYAFVNFTSSVAAERFRREFENFSWGNLGYRNKICEITVAKYQGKEELSQHFKNSRFTCHTDEYLPVVLSPPSNGFTAYTLTTLGNRVSLRGGGSSRLSSLR